MRGRKYIVWDPDSARRLTIWRPWWMPFKRRRFATLNEAIRYNKRLSMVPIDLTGTEEQFADAIRASRVEEGNNP